MGSGAFGINALLTHVDQWRYRDPSGGHIEYAGTVGGTGLGRSLPRFKSLLNLTYAVGHLTLLTRWQYLSSSQDVAVRDFEVPAYNYVDLGAGYAVKEGTLRGLSLQVGVDNVGDKAPPIFPTWQQANTDPSQYDVLGRRYYVRLQYAFL
jgi:outer membrane receptor protein involved in Fe transport